jgi:hypothetical protein
MCDTDQKSHALDTRGLASVMVLRGISQYLAINSGGAALPSGFVADIRVEWTEE